MDDEFKLCWKNFQDNIASGFQNLYDRGDLVDVTLACDGKLLHAHKIVLAICSPYFQEIFITNPCKHPIIILKDVHFNIMCELLEFMYQGVVNVKHTELQSFMKIGQLLQIKGLATNSSASTLTEKSPSDTQNAKNLTSKLCADSITNNNVVNEPKIDNEGMSKNVQSKSDATSMEGNISPSSSPTPLSTNQQLKNTRDTPNSLESYSNLKRSSDLNNDSLLIHSKKQLRRSISHDNSAGEQSDEHDNAGGGMEHVNPEDFFLSAIPHISMGEGSSRYELSNVKKEGDHSNSSSSIRNSFGSSFGFEYNLYKNASGSNTGTDYSNDLHLPNDYSKNFGNHMDIPPIAPGEHWFQGKLEFMLSQRGKPLLVHDGHTFGIQYVRKDKKYWQCNLSRKFNCKARVTTTDTGEIIVTNNEHCHTEIRQHLRKDYQRNKVMMNALINLSSNRLAENLRRQSVNSSISSSLSNLQNLSALVGNTTATAMLNASSPPPINLQSSKSEENERSAPLPNFGGNELEPSNMKITSFQHSYNSSSQQHHDNNDLPLDCGIKTLKNEEKQDLSMTAKNNWSPCSSRNEAVN